jgi:hypothetical protein
MTHSNCQGNCEKKKKQNNIRFFSDPFFTPFPICLKQVDDWEWVGRGARFDACIGKETLLKKIFCFMHR